MVKIKRVCNLDDDDKNKITEFLEERNVVISHSDIIDFIELIDGMIQDAHETE